MKYIGVFFLHIVAVLFMIQGWYILASVSFIYLSIRYSSYTLIPIAILTDAYFGAFYAVPILSIYATLWCVLVEYFRPQMIVARSKYG